MRLKNKNVMVTGATSGIGRACAKAFAAEGANLIIMARREEVLNDLKCELAKEFGTKSYIKKCDVRDFEQVKSAIESIPAEFQPIGILVNNAGLARGVGKIYDAELNDWEEMIDTNVKGLLYVSRIIVPKMVERKQGHVINIGSIAGWEPYGGGSVYCGTKHAVRAISKSMAIDLNGTGVKVTEIDPGMVETKFSEVRFHGDCEKAKNVYTGITPLVGEDIAELAVFAATRKSHVMIQTMLVTPTAQASATVCHREK
ncbi:MAG: SDR family NAD(P)-dependent oxidoreductase [Candidatus Kapabacteria bacterium]|nr:SDR family NAD(P)-dependent oxidoreductase [Candidatus Kapabacteria bacterium]